MPKPRVSAAGLTGSCLCNALTLSWSGSDHAPVIVSGCVIKIETWEIPLSSQRCLIGRARQRRERARDDKVRKSSLNVSGFGMERETGCSM